MVVGAALGKEIRSKGVMENEKRKLYKKCKIP